MSTYYAIQDDKCLAEISTVFEDNIADSKTLGAVKLLDNPISSNVESSGEYAFSAVGASKLRENISTLESEIKTTQADIQSRANSLSTMIDDLQNKLDKLLSTVADSTTLGLIKLLDNPISSNVGSAAEYAFSAVGAYNMRTALQIPVGACICVTTSLENETILANTLGYGTWSEVGSITVGTMTLYYYRRTA